MLSPTTYANLLPHMYRACTKLQWQLFKNMFIPFEFLHEFLRQGHEKSAPMGQKINKLLKSKGVGALLFAGEMAKASLGLARLRRSAQPGWRGSWTEMPFLALAGWLDVLL